MTSGRRSARCRGRVGTLPSRPTQRRRARADSLSSRPWQARRPRRRPGSTSGGRVPRAQPTPTRGRSGVRAGGGRAAGARARAGVQDAGRRGRRRADGRRSSRCRRRSTSRRWRRRSAASGRRWPTSPRPSGPPATSRAASRPLGQRKRLPTVLDSSAELSTRCSAARAPRAGDRAGARATSRASPGRFARSRLSRAGQRHRRSRASAVTAARRPGASDLRLWSPRSSTTSRPGGGLGAAERVALALHDQHGDGRRGELGEAVLLRPARRVHGEREAQHAGRPACRGRAARHARAGAAAAERAAAGSVRRGRARRPPARPCRAGAAGAGARRPATR